MCPAVSECVLVRLGVSGYVEFVSGCVGGPLGMFGCIRVCLDASVSV